MKEKLDRLKNFGYESETEISMLGSNAKMNEVQAAFGLATLKHIDAALIKRKNVASFYINNLMGVKGISLPIVDKNITMNYSYFPILINENKYGMSRDDLFKN